MISKRTCATLAISMFLILIPGVASASAAPGSGSSTAAYRALAGRAVTALYGRLFVPRRGWRMCLGLRVRCHVRDQDWGADSLTYVAWLDYSLTRDRRVPPMMAQLSRAAQDYRTWIGNGSDVPLWDSIANSREYQVSVARDPKRPDNHALVLAERAFAFVDSGPFATKFARGHCPAIDYQHPDGVKPQGFGARDLKTLETDSNYIKAALLLSAETTGSQRQAYLAKAKQRYAAVRQYYLEGNLYTTYVFDTKTACTPDPGQFFASVNGNMIWDGNRLYQLTRRAGYLADALATARSVTARLSDGAGVFEDMQSEYDTVEPLVEGMYALAAAGHRVGRQWLLANAAAAAAGWVRSGAAAGLYGRFFGGPPPRRAVTAWQANGAVALLLAAARLAPGGRPGRPGYWRAARFHRDDRWLGARRSVRIAFTGRAVTIIGTIGERCCQLGYARLRIDGRAAVDNTGIWQNCDNFRPMPGSVLFAWRWRRAGRHVIAIVPGPADPMLGRPFFHMVGYYTVS
jgi:hypothetical protein